MRFGSRRWQILALMTMALVGIGFGIWLLRQGFISLGCIWIGLFLWRAQQFAVWFIAPAKAPSDVTPPLSSRWQRLLLSIVCLLGAAVCAVRSLLVVVVARAVAGWSCFRSFRVACVGPSDD